MASPDAVTRDESLTRAPVVLAAATVIVWVVLAALDHDGAGWLLLPALALATAVTPWRAGGTSPQNLRASVPLIIGVLAILVLLGLCIADA